MWDEDARHTFFAHENANFSDSPLEAGKAFKFAQKGDFASSGSMGEILGAATYSGELNETSIVLQLSFGHFCALLTGDLPSQMEGQLDNLAPCQVLKVPHHGSKSSTSQAFLQKVKPQLAVISVGKNRFGHPTKEVIDRLKSLKIKTLRTDQQGEIEIVSDGRRWYNAL